MNLVFFLHPTFENHKSMPRYASLLITGFKEKGYSVEAWTSPAFFVKIPAPHAMKKWLGYIDMYLLFPILVKIRMLFQKKETLYIITDHALGPWVPLVKNKKHIVHCHDFLAQFSALDIIKYVNTSVTGKLYQRYIRWGFRKSRNFISVSCKTKADLHSLLVKQPEISEVVYNALNNVFEPLEKSSVIEPLEKSFGVSLKNGFILNVGGNQWYKNRTGVVDIYTQWRNKYKREIPLILVGESPSEELYQAKSKSAYSESIYFLTNVSDSDVKLFYASADMLLFPSIAEGFGWPIAEAMASGTIVVTTNDAPMTEVAGGAAILIEKQPAEKEAYDEWIQDSADKIQQFYLLSPEEKKQMINNGLENTKRFSRQIMLDKLEELYSTIGIKA